MFRPVSQRAKLLGHTVPIPSDQSQLWAQKALDPAWSENALQEPGAEMWEVSVPGEEPSRPRWQVGSRVVSADGAAQEATGRPQCGSGAQPCCREPS